MGILLRISCVCFLVTGSLLAQSDVPFRSTYSPELPNPVLRLTNNYDFSITAFVVTMNPHGKPIGEEGTLFFDVAISQSPKMMIKSGATFDIPVAYASGVAPENVDPKIRAVIFADGKSLGDSHWIEILLQRRKRAYKNWRAMEDLLVTRSLEHVSRVEIAKELRQIGQDSWSRRNINPTMSSLDRQLFETVAKNLEQLRVNSQVEDSAQIAHLISVLKSWHKSLEDAKPTLNLDVESTR